MDHGDARPAAASPPVTHDNVIYYFSALNILILDDIKNLNTVRELIMRIDIDIHVFNSKSRGKRASDPPKGRCSQPPVDTCNSSQVTSALPNSSIEIGYLRREWRESWREGERGMMNGGMEQ
ncbi:hypothetical protein EVAR_81944_1 [Eumeta japonica]|uniref:Uncharacterized protein n=1 Tax=Eumeta variegata TaxID=151549 RepID=A0A4C1ZHQ8_EUMVA|nr:hypothetical protein EVAR_81944_1 [Eumeta japonica]